MMDTFHKICYVIKHNPSTIDNYNNALTCCKHILSANTIYGMKCTRELKELCIRAIKNELTLNETKKELFNVIHRILIAETPYSLDSYFQALEFRRPVKEQFYLPRRKQLLPIVRKLEALLISNELDELFLSQPARTGKSTLAMFVTSWVLGVNPELANLYVTFSGNTANSFYKGITEILNDKYTYCWHEIFDQVEYDERSFCNSKEGYVDTGRIKRYHSLTSRSIDGSLNGSCDCSGILIADDLVSGIEEALNPNRVWSVWQKVQNDMLTRAKQGAKMLWIGTRWSIADPIGKRIEILTTEPQFATRRFEIFNVPALNKKDESNFDYLYNVGFSTEHYKQVRASFDSVGDIASWSAQYMGEPIERSGLLFPADELQYYDGTLPEETPTEICAPVDVAWGGGDACACPCLVVYRDKKLRNVYDVYIPKVVFEYGDKYQSQPKICQMIADYNITRMCVEKNNRGEDYKIDIETKLREKGVKCNISCKSASTQVSKEAKIFASAPDIKTRFHFLESSKRDKPYQQFMQQLIGYTINGNNKHDDAPDCLAQGVDMLRPQQTISFEIFKRPF